MRPGGNKKSTSDMREIMRKGNKDSSLLLGKTCIKQYIGSLRAAEKNGTLNLQNVFLDDSDDDEEVSGCDSKAEVLMLTTKCLTMIIAKEEKLEFGERLSCSTFSKRELYFFIALSFQPRGEPEGENLLGFASELPLKCCCFLVVCVFESYTSEFGCTHSKYKEVQKLRVKLEHVPEGVSQHHNGRYPKVFLMCVFLCLNQETFIQATSLYFDNSISILRQHIIISKVVLVF